MPSMMQIAYEDAEAEFNDACVAYKQAAADLKRSKSAKNRVAMLSASERHEACAVAMRNAHDALSREATMARRIEALAPRRALKEAQGKLF